MSFSNLNKKELLAAAELFDVYVTDKNTNPEIVAALEETEGATWSNYKKFLAAKEDTDNFRPVEDDTSVSNTNAYETKPEAKVDTVGPAAQAVEFKEKMVVVKMERKNPSFEILGYKFTKSQPFKVVTEAEAQKIIDTAEGGGFRIATPAETRSYFA